MTSFAQRLRYLRKQHRLTQKELGEKLGVSGPTVTRWEKGQFEPETDKLKDISDFFGVTIDYLLGNDGNKDKQEADVTDILEQLKKRPYARDPETGELKRIPPEQRQIIADIILGYLRRDGKLPDDDGEDLKSGSQ